MDKQRANQFLFKVFGDISATASIGCVYVGDRAGIFRAMLGAGPRTPTQVAEDAGIEPRYAQEWLPAMAAAGYLDFDAENGTYDLPDEHAVVLADEESSKFLGGVVQMVITSGMRAPDVARAFVDGGGVPFADYGEEFVEGVARANSPTFRNFVARKWVPLSEDAHAALEAGGTVVDVGCGAGELAMAISKQYASATVVGIDLDEASLARAERLVEAEGLGPRCSFRAGCATDVDELGPFDVAITYDVVHDLARPLEALRAIRGAIGEDGIYLMAEPNCASDVAANMHPIGAFYYAASTLHCLPQSLAEGGAGLGAAWGSDRARELTAEAGFTRFRSLPVGNPMTAFYEIRP